LLLKNQKQPEKRARTKEDRHTITLAHSPHSLLAAMEGDLAFAKNGTL
jgi:hypothetical protein